MKNRFGIPEEFVKKLSERDKLCVYCRKEMIYPYNPQNHKDSATIEHFKEKGPFYWWNGLKEEEIAYCCGSCNSSRSNLNLDEWFKTKYCINNNITRNTVAEPVKKFLSVSQLEM